MRISPWWILAVLGFGAATFTHADPDLWGHLRFGLDFLETGRLTASDPYSFTQDRPWHNHEWLSEAVMAAAWKAGGVTGLVLLKAALVLAAASLVWGASRGAAPIARLLSLGWLIFCAVHMTSTLRPQLWSFIAMAILARQLLAPSRAAYLVLPVTFAVWANMHGGWFIGLGLFGAWIVGGGVMEPGQQMRTFALGLACAIATLATPYGIGTWTFILTTVRFERTITEWRPLWEGASVAEWTAWIGTTAALFYFAASARARPVARWIVLALLAWSALRIMRVGSLYATVACVFAGPWLAARWPARPVGERRLPRGAGLLLAVPAAVVLLAAVRLTATAAMCIPTTGPWQPDATVARLLASAPPGRLLTTFDWGQFAIWHLGPQIKVSIDGRRETVYSNEQLSRHESVMAATDNGLRVFEAWRPDYIWLPQSAATLKEAALGRGYGVVGESDRSWLAARVPIVGQNFAGMRACFPD